MSTDKHTKGLLQVNSRDRSQICDTDGAGRGCAPVAVMQGMPAEKVDNARRMVACWNACDGLSTKVIENIVLTDGSIKPRLQALVSSRDELLEILLELSKGFIGRYVDDERSDCEIDAHQEEWERKAVAAIAKLAWSEA